MALNLDGSYEQIKFHDYESVLLYNNTQYETYVPHWHASTEIIMPVKGDYTIICNGTNYYLKERDILIIAPGTVHSIPACHGQRYIFLADFFHYIKSDCFSTIQAALSPVTLINGNTLPEIHDTCAQLISSCAEEYFGENRFRETAVFHFLVQLFLLVGRTLSDESAVFHDISPDKKRHYTEAFSSVCEYIHQHYAENLCVDTAASMTGFSKYHFLRLFKQFTGDTFYHYVNAQRIYHACLLLSDPEKNITEVAMSCGFHSISSFLRIFKLQKGCTPTEFRRIHNTTNTSITLPASD